MLCKFLGLLLFFVLVGSGSVAKAFVDPAVLSPEHPKAGDLIKVEVRAGFCDGFPGAQDSAKVTRAGNHLHMTIEMIHSEYSDFCNFTPFIFKFWVGRLPAGFYDLIVDTTYKPWYGPDVVATIGNLTFTVDESEGDSLAFVPATSSEVLVLLAALISCAAAVSLRRGKFLMLLLLVNQATTTDGIAQAPMKYAEVLVIAGSGAPTASQIVEHDFSSNGPLPLQSLAVGNPQSASYLLPIRATGAHADGHSLRTIQG